MLPKELDFTRWTFAAILVSYPLVYYFVQSATRYRFPIVWITCLLAAYAVLKFVAGRLDVPARQKTSLESNSQQFAEPGAVRTVAEQGTQDA
jgi:hypothetical protein